MTQQSHGRLSFTGWKGRLALGAVIALPAAMALVGGAWLAFEALGVRFENAEVQRRNQAVTLVRSAAENLKDEISVIRSEALSIRELQRADAPDLLPSLFHSILCGAEVEARDGAAPLVSRVLKRPDWNEGAAVDEDYLSNAVSRVNWTEFSKTGMAVLRLKQDPSRNAEWLAFLFPVIGSGDSARGAALAIVDPSEAFPVFANWNGRSEGGSLRAYLIGGDGTVLAHSQKSYAGADFSHTEVFQQGIAPLLEGKRESGSGKFVSIDQLPAQAAYVKAGTMPLGIVVERLEPLSSEAFLSGSLARAMIERTATPLMAMLGALAAMVFLGSAWLRSRLAVQADCARTKAENAHELDALEAAIANPKASHSGGAEAAGPPTWGTPSFTIQEIRTPSVGRAATVSKTAAQDGEISDARNGLDSQIVEQALSRELNQDPARARAEQRKRIAISKFEADLMELSGDEPGEALQVALSKLTGLARELCHTPCLFFAFRPEENRALLTACSGLGPQDLAQLSGVSFSVADELPARVAQSAKAGRIHSLSDYIPLASLMMRRFQAMDFRAWAVPGGKSGKFLGALVVLSAEGEAQDGVRQNTESLARIIRSAGLFCENSPSGPPGNS